MRWLVMIVWMPSHICSHHICCHWFKPECVHPKNESTEDRAQDPQAEAKMVAKKVKTECKLRCLSATAAQKAKDQKQADDKGTAQELANKLRQAPSFVKKFYDGKFKFAKMSNPDKKEFVE